MRILALIAVLQAAHAQHGDLEVGVDIGVTDYWQGLEKNPALTAFTQSVVDLDEGTPEGAPRYKVLALRWDEEDARAIDYEHPDSNGGVDPESLPAVSYSMGTLEGLTTHLRHFGYPNAMDVASEDYSIEDDEIDLGSGAYIQVSWEMRGPVFIPAYTNGPDHPDQTFWHGEPTTDVIKAAREAFILKAREEGNS